MNTSLTLETLEVFKLAKELSSTGWKIYQIIDWRKSKNTKDQFLDSTDSVGANVSEGYGRFHYLDRIKFLYNARGSLYESKYWFDLLNERSLISNDTLKKEYLQIYDGLKPKLNNFINSLYKNKDLHLTHNS
ncbi:hypothetical protein A2866_06010 [Candidatus Roizmanbacteria bacterium RIFCSPHIGHO2_01_FULL_39_8]|uniref:Four helix bundle protein n=3 Tax=Candidatus Roizmaniibacteriota TaxID=1752723 RepID=A0A1F7GFI9_9BACT|nr:MAG: hypothetical protein A2866_06010 [Candidatus Roizmanbacteria bacterium RIFCSPHIGHO2_01_FULL_39_8]OGK25629.1 MAG: hypothetical protein A3C28_00465 [Candidatus Roizmanbacteria bacterium RIFCSPHIGHO2_02_FULL_39_9]OGK37337.1 MAG: hypothetical protein A3F60_04095 [Candidatus Roizmanbacteria bacterium RIFCSPHIGHO2_12_FULL_39_8]